MRPIASIRGPYFPAPEFLDYQEQTQAFEDVVGTSRDAVHWVSEAGAERLSIAWMTSNGFAFLGVPPLIGRVFGASDAAPGCAASCGHGPSHLGQALQRRPRRHRPHARAQRRSHERSSA